MTGGVPLNYVELHKNTGQSNDLAWRDSALFAAQGIVRRVVDINTVVAVPAVNATGFSQPVTVTLLRPSSALFENAVEPQEGDQVLIVALDLKASGMFDSEEPIIDPNAQRRGLFSGVGILLSTFKGLATTTALHGREGENNLLRLESAALVSLLLSRALTAVFDSVSGNEELVKLAFGELSPLLVEHRSAVTRRHGFDEDAEGKEITVPAPVSERYSVEAPVTKSIQGAQTIVVGVDAEENATEAPVDIRIGEQADIDLVSKSGLTLHFDKAVFFETVDGHTMKVGGDLAIEVGGKVSITSAGCTINNVLEVK
jgi:hypothetical protein